MALICVQSQPDSVKVGPVNEVPWHGLEWCVSGGRAVTVGCSCGPVLSVEGVNRAPIQPLLYQRYIWAVPWWWQPELSCRP